MRNHSQRSMKKLKRDGGSVAPSPGRIPRGTKKIDRNPASSSMPSDWYDEKSWRAAMQDRKRIAHNATLSRGQTLATRRSEQMRPAPTSATSAVSDALIQNNVGAYQTRSTTPNIEDSSCRYMRAGRIPRSPMRPRIWNA